MYKNYWLKGFISGIVLTYVCLFSAVKVPVNTPKKHQEVQSTVSAVKSTPYPTPSGSEYHTDFTFDNVAIRINEVRLSRGLPQLMTDEYLSKEAQGELIENCPVSSHDNFRENVKSGTFKNYQQVGEVLASQENMTPLQAVTNFMDSPTHADLIIGNYGWTMMGIGYTDSPIRCLAVIFGK